MDQPAIWSTLNLVGRFLLDEFGDAVLRRGSGVLDVAGGKGEVAFELVNLNGIPATVVDPRPLCLTHFCRWLLVGLSPI